MGYEVLKFHTKEIGYFSISFIEMFARLEKLNANVLEKICYQKVEDIKSLVDNSDVTDLSTRIEVSVERICKSIEGCSKAESILKAIED